MINNDAVAVPPNADASYSTKCSFWKIITNLGKSEVHYFTKGMTAGRGYLALAAIIFGNWRPLRGVAACFLFGFATALELTNRWNIPEQLLHSLPYILTMVVLVGFVGASRPPASLGKMKS